MSVMSVLLVSVCLMFAGSHGAVYYKNGTALSGDDLIELCYDEQICNTHFSKNVYASTTPVLDHEWTPLLFPEMYDQFDSESECGSGSKFISMDTCAQIHSPMTLYHPQGDVTVEYVQEQYTLKWDNIRNSKTPIYDSFLDNTVAYWVDDIAKYHSLWKEIGADIVYLKWQVKKGALSNSEIQDKQYYSIMTHNGDATTGSTLTQYELVSDTFSGLTKEIEDKMIESEQRVFFDSETDYRSFGVGCAATPIGARRAVTSIDDNVEWYTTIFQAGIEDYDKQVIVDEWVDYNGNVVKYAHIKLYPSEEATTVSFFEREMVDSTYGDFTVLDFEKTMTEAHNENMIGPYCGIDRWFDMHYAVSLDDDTMSEKILQTMMKSGEKYSVYKEWSASSSYFAFIYMTEPNGHSVQLVFTAGNTISFLTDPQNWNADWCPMECTDEMSQYTFGDQIATFVWDDLDAAAEEEEEQEKQENSVWFGLSPSSSDNFNLIVSIVGIFIVLVIAAMIHFYSKCNDSFKYEKIPQ